MKFQSQFYHFYSKKVFDSVVCEMAAILSRPQCVKTWRTIVQSYTMQRYIAHITLTSYEHYDVSNHREHDWIYQRVQLTTKKTPNHRITGPFWWDSTVSIGFPSKGTDDPDKTFSPWRHHAHQYAAKRDHYIFFNNSLSRTDDWVNCSHELLL